MIKELNYTNRNRKLNVFFIIIFIVIFVLAQLSLALNSFSLYVLVPFVFLYSLIQNPKLIWNYKPLLYFLLLILLSAVTSINSVHMDDSQRELKTLLGSYAVCYIVTQFSIKNLKYIHLFYVLYIFLFFVVIYRGYIEGLTYSTTERFSTDDLNANFFGYVGFYAIVSSFFVWQFAKFFIIRINRNNTTYIFLFVSSVILSIMANIFAATKAGTAISLLATGLFITTKYLIPFSLKKVRNVFLLSIIILIAIFSLNIMLEGSILQERVKTESIAEDSRPRLLEGAFNVGMKNLLLGVGPANFKYYSYNGGFAHSTFLEIFANNGIFALALFLAMLFPFFMNVWNYKPPNDEQKKFKLYLLIFFTLFIVYNFFYVFHTSPFLISFYYLVLIHSYYSLQNSQIARRDKKLPIR